jgi:hypothetical protein
MMWGTKDRSMPAFIGSGGSVPPRPMLMCCQRAANSNMKTSDPLNDPHKAVAIATPTL